MKRFVNLIRAILKFGMPLSLLLAPILAIYGWTAPWAPIQPALGRYAGETPVLIGASYQARYTRSGSTVSASRSYIMVPGVLSDPQLITFTQLNQEPVAVTQSRACLALMVAWWTLCIFGTWWFWLRRVPPNNSFKPNPLRGSA